jgi:uncharacterized protein (DUF2062 family)
MAFPTFFGYNEKYLNVTNEGQARMWKNIYRKLKYEYYKLIRMKGAPSFIARGFSIGMFIEFITLPTFGLAFLLLFPLTRLFRCSFPASLIAFVIGKIILPAFMLINLKLGNVLIGSKLQDPGEQSTDGLVTLIKQNLLAYLTGSAVVGFVVAVAGYFLVNAALQWYRKKRARRVVVPERSTS